jgi:hypothetical protein
MNDAVLNENTTADAPLPTNPGAIILAGLMLTNAFDWKTSPQGEAYWAEVSDNLRGILEAAAENDGADVE